MRFISPLGFVFALILACAVVASGIAFLTVPANLERSVVMVSNAVGHGTGVYIGHGQVITAGHVAKEADVNGKLTVKLGNKTAVATVAWFDEDADVALLKIDLPLAGMTAAKLSCSSPDVRVGDELEAIGDPLDFINLHTWGRVAAGVLEREDAGKKQVNLIADLTIASGNSGGPVFSRGELVGITVAMASTMLQIGPLPAPVLFPLTYIIPKSVICKGLAEHK